VEIEALNGAEIANGSTEVLPNVLPIKAFAAFFPGISCPDFVGLSFVIRSSASHKNSGSQW
jgi:hypothetical protein